MQSIPSRRPHSPISDTELSRRVRDMLRADRTPEAPNTAGLHTVLKHGLGMDFITARKVERAVDAGITPNELARLYALLRPVVAARAEKAVGIGTEETMKRVARDAVPAVREIISRFLEA